MKELIKLRGLRKALNNYKREMKEKGLDKIETDAMRLDAATFNAKKQFYEKQYFRVLDRYEARQRIGLWDSRALNSFYNACMKMKDKGEYAVDKKMFHAFIDGFPEWYANRNEHSIEGREFALSFREFLNLNMLEELSQGYYETINSMRTKEDKL